jgi:hypothetical protein
LVVVLPTTMLSLRSATLLVLLCAPAKLDAFHVPAPLLVRHAPSTIMTTATAQNQALVSSAIKLQMSSGVATTSEEEEEVVEKKGFIQKVCVTNIYIGIISCACSCRFLLLTLEIYSPTSFRLSAIVIVVVIHRLGTN